MDQLHRRGFPALDGAFRLLRAEVEGEPQTMLSDHHRHIALLFVRFIGGVDQLYAIALVERPRLVVIDVGEEGEMGLRVDRRRYGDRLAGAALPGVEARFIQHLRSFPTQLVEQAVGHKQRRQINLHLARIVDGLPQFCDTVTQVGQRFLRLVSFGELPVKGVGHADAIFTGHGENQLLLPAAQRHIYRDAAFAGGL